MTHNDNAVEFRARLVAGDPAAIAELYAAIDAIKKRGREKYEKREEARKKEESGT